VTSFRPPNRALVAYSLTMRSTVAMAPSISPGIIRTPLARDEMNGPGAAGYQAILYKSAAGRVGTADELATVAADPVHRRGRLTSERQKPWR
jgi:hypothetical protein